MYLTTYGSVYFRLIVNNVLKEIVQIIYGLYNLHFVTNVQVTDCSVTSVIIMHVINLAEHYQIMDFLSKKIQFSLHDQENKDEWVTVIYFNSVLQ